MSQSSSSVTESNSVVQRNNPPSADQNNPFWITVAFTLNYIIGSGFLTLPWAFEQAGIMLGVFVLLVFGFFSMISARFILEAMSRAETLEEFHTGEIEMKAGNYRSVANPVHEEDHDHIDQHGDNQVRRSSSVSSENQSHDEERALTIRDQSNTLPITDPTAGEETKTSIDLEQPPSHENDEHFNDNHDHNHHHPQHEHQQNNSKGRKREITELCHIFLGNGGKQAYVSIICIFLYGILWAYTTVFANAFTAVVGDSFGPSAYVIFVVVFACCVVPVSIMEFSEQVYIQVSLSIFRVVMVFAMIFSIIIAYYTADNEFQLPDNYQAEQVASELFRADWSKFYILTPIAAYAFIFHHSVPALAEPITKKDTLNSLFQTALIISVTFYIALAAVISGYFGQSTLASSNLNWKDYLATNPSKVASIFGGVVRIFVLLFPAVDVASAFPLNAFTLGNNIMTAYYGKDIHQHAGSRWKTSIFRLLAAIPPIFGALFIQDLGTITSWTGMTGFAIVFVFPPLLSHSSHKRLEALSISPDTRHTSFWTNRYFQVLLFLSGIMLTIYVGTILITTSG